MSATSRRRFLGTSALAGIAGLSPAAAVLAAAPPPLSRSWFAPHAGSDFAVTDAQGRHAVLVLDELVPLPHAHGYATPAQAAQWCFSARFSVRRGAAPVSGLATMDHPVLGRMAMMISPVDGAGALEAVFNRVRLG